MIERTDDRTAGDETKAFTESNRRAWNASAPLHRRQLGWQRLVEGFASRDFPTLDATLTKHLKAISVADRSVVQIGCNNGRELFLEQAEALATIARREVDSSLDCSGPAPRC